MKMVLRIFVVFVAMAAFVFLPYYTTTWIAAKDSDAMDGGLFKSWLIGWTLIFAGCVAIFILYVLVILFSTSIRWIKTGKWDFYL